ncbi:MAG TPA: 23S rRNA (adenine(2503)-C(2))-methyltransferase RlmN [Actinobacteria bacterium]|nr:23S rRNA (adenine(2503)-C(2))-methyltransferase RlmN [Actinomycetota bacterium]
MTTPGELVFVAPKAKRPPQHLADLDPSERANLARELNVPTFRIEQIAHHYFERFEIDPDVMTDLPAADRKRWIDAVLPTLLTPVRTITCDNETTAKQLWRLHDGVMVESVVMRYPERATVCISSQAGCGMNCPFCATGQAGLTRNLSTGEIVDQVVAAARLLAEGGVGGSPVRLSNVVFMGMGEPLANYKAVMGALRRLTDKDSHGLGLSRRSITVSTVGLVPRIDQLTDENLPVTLAVSLHAPDDELRDTLVPVNTRWKVSEVLEAADRYSRSTGRRYSIEYALIKDINDQGWRADMLAQRLRGRLVHVNLIPLNPTPGYEVRGSSRNQVQAFCDQLVGMGANATIRRNRGTDIAAACGQLAAGQPVQISRSK